MTDPSGGPSGPASKRQSGPSQSPKPGVSGADPAGAPDARAEEAQAALDQIRTQAGGALSGSELKRRFGLDDDPESDAPPLDWRLTPRNVILQLLAVALFVGVIWFLVALVSDSLSVLFG